MCMLDLVYTYVSNWVVYIPFMVSFCFSVAWRKENVTKTSQM